MSIVYLNGEFLPAEQAHVPVLDRGFLFGDGVYEVVPAYGGRLLRLDQHLARLEQSLAGIRMHPPLEREAWARILEELIRRNDGGPDISVYLQVTRGVAPKRDHAFPAEVRPTVFAMTSPIPPVPARVLEEGVAAITLDDIRWSYCNIKAITLLPNVLLRQQAVDGGAAEAILIRDGHAIEGSASNLFVVLEGVIVTPPLGPRLLPGITRDLVLELCARHGLPHREADITEAELRGAREIWVTSSTKEVVPVTRLDGQPVGDGSPGPLWRNVIGLYQDHKAALREGRAA